MQMLTIICINIDLTYRNYAHTAETKTKQTIEHFIANCPKWAFLRLQYLDCCHGNINTISDNTLSEIILYIKKLNDFPFRNRVARKIWVVTIIRCGVEGRHAIAPVRAVLYCTHVQDRNTRKEDRWLEFCGGGRGGIPPFPIKRSPAHR